MLKDAWLFDYVCVGACSHCGCCERGYHVGDGAASVDFGIVGTISHIGYVFSDASVSHSFIPLLLLW